MALFAQELSVGVALFAQELPVGVALLAQEMLHPLVA